MWKVFWLKFCVFVDCAFILENQWSVIEIDKVSHNKEYKINRVQKKIYYLFIQRSIISENYLKFEGVWKKPTKIPSNGKRKNSSNQESKHLLEQKSKCLWEN